MQADLVTVLKKIPYAWGDSIRLLNGKNEEFMQRYITEMKPLSLT